MFMGYRPLNTNLHKYLKVIVISFVAIIVFSFGLHVQRAEAQSRVAGEIVKSEVPLLLNSGLTEAKEAEVTVMLWFEDKDIPLSIQTNTPTSDWIWTYKELEKDNGKVALTLTGERRLNKNEEISLFAWYTTMVPQIEKVGGKIYLDERIPQAIDISSYLSKTNTVPTQWVLIDNLVSIAAYQSNLETSVMAGQDRINIQLLSRGKNTEGQAVLAIPVLLKQF